MSQATAKDHAHVELESTTSLFDVLHNSLILRQVAPHLSIHSLLQLSATSKGFRSLIHNTPGVFRYLDLTRVKRAKVLPCLCDNAVWLNERKNQSLPDYPVPSRPLRWVLGAIRQQNILQNVQTLILDGLSVTAELCHEIINDPSYRVRVLSIRQVINLHYSKFCKSLNYACRPNRPDGTPSLKALYMFGVANAESGKMIPSMSTCWGRDDWWCKRGRLVTRSLTREWVNCIVACHGIIAFDAVLCQGPRHENSPAFGRIPMLAHAAPAPANHAVGGCDSCGTAPEGLLMHETCPPLHLPLLSPIPLMSSSVRAATCPSQPGQSFAPRCDECLEDRYCARCHKWWCEACYRLVDQRQHVGVREEDGVAISTQMLVNAPIFK
ncbi:hypothetical protein E4U54_008259, partial [Claviceps lovelessii]